MSQENTQSNIKPNLESIHEIPVTTHATILRKMVWGLAGADSRLMSRCPRATSNAAFCLGLTLLIPFAMGTFGAGYTVYSISRNLAGAIVGGVLFGIFILLIDIAIMTSSTRYIDVTGLFRQMRNSGNSNASWMSYIGSKQRKKYSMDENPLMRFFQFMIRFALSFVLSLVIGHSLLLAVFDGRIQTYNAEQKEGELKRIEDTWKAQDETIRAKTPVKPEAPQIDEIDIDNIQVTQEKDTADLQEKIDAAKIDLANCQNNIKAAQKELSEKNDAATRELYGKGVSGLSGDGDAYKDKVAEADLIKKNLDELTSNQKTISDDIVALTDQRRIALEEAAKEKAKQQQNALDQQASQLALRNAQYQTDLKEYNEEALPAFNKLISDNDNQKRQKIEAANRNRGDLLTKSEALSEITKNSKELAFWKWMIIAAMVGLDIVPLLIKFTKSVDAYDELASLERFLFRNDLCDVVKETKL